MTDAAPPLPRWIEELHPFDERYLVPVENHQIHVMERGEGRAVLALHGNPTWGFLYRQVARELSGEPFRFIAPDLVGLGLSTRPRHVTAHSLENQARWIAGLIDALSLEDWVLVVQDWGGPIGLLAASRVARPPAAVVLLNTVIGPPRPGFRSTTFHQLARMPVVSDVVFRGLGFPQRMLWMAQRDRKSMRGAVGRAYEWPLQDREGRMTPLALARMVPDSMEHPSIPPLRVAREYIESFEGPIAAVWGEDDPVLGSVGRRVQKVLPHARFIHTRAGHFLQEEVPRPIADAIRHVDRRL